MSGSTDLVQHNPRMGLPPAAEAERMWKLAHQVQHTDLVPKDFRGKPEAVLACALAGREIGLDFFESMRSFYVVDGKPTESAELLHTLALRAGHDVWVESATSRGATVRGRRRDWPDDRADAAVEWTVEDAVTAELIDWDCFDEWPRHVTKQITKRRRDGGTYTVEGCECKDNWRKYARAMFRSRAITEMVRQLCPEVTVGATYTPEELGAEVAGPGGRPEGAAVGWGAARGFDLPEVGDIDGMWVASHDVDQVLAVVDHYGPDTVVEAAGDVPLGEWVVRCERSGEGRPRLLEALGVRVDEDDEAEASDDDDVVEAEIVEDGDDVQEPAPDGGSPGGNDDQQPGVAPDDASAGDPPEGGPPDDGGPTVEEQLVADYTREELDDMAGDLDVDSPESLPNKSAVAAAIVKARRARAAQQDSEEGDDGAEESAQPASEPAAGSGGEQTVPPADTGDVELSVSQKALLKSIAIQSKALGYGADDDRHQLIRATTEWMDAHVDRWEWGTLGSGTAVVKASPVAGKLLLAEGFHRVKKGPLQASYDGDGRLTLVDGRDREGAA